MKKETDNNAVYNKIIKLYDSTVKSLDEITLNIIDFYYYKYKYIELELKTLTEKKPPKILKKRLKEWKDKKIELEREKYYLIKKIKEELNEFKR